MTNIPNEYDTVETATTIIANYLGCYLTEASREISDKREAFIAAILLAVNKHSNSHELNRAKPKLLKAEQWGMRCPGGR